MESITLHTLARRYLMSRDEKLRAEYATLPNDGRKHFGYTDEAKRIFPRYNVVAAMLREVERLDSDDLPLLDRLATALATAASAARSVFTTDLDAVEAEATAAERELFRRSIKSWVAERDLVVEPLGYRRVFSDEEVQGWRRRLEERWGFARDQTLWHPLIAETVPEDVVVVNADAMWDADGFERVHEALTAMGLRRVVEIREHGDPSCLLDLDGFEPSYTGAEGVWTDETLDWIAYASHESSVAFGGTLAERLRTSWKDLTGWGWVPVWDQPAK